VFSDGIEYKSLDLFRTLYQLPVSSAMTLTLTQRQDATNMAASEPTHINLK
jgi:hypothetical protein